MHSAKDNQEETNSSSLLSGFSVNEDFDYITGELKYTDKFEMVGPYIRNEGSYKASLIRMVSGDKGYQRIVCSFKMDNIYKAHKEDSPDRKQGCRG